MTAPNRKHPHDLQQVGLPSGLDEAAGLNRQSQNTRGLKAALATSFLNPKNRPLASQKTWKQPGARHVGRLPQHQPLREGEDLGGRVVDLQVFGQINACPRSDRRATEGQNPKPRQPQPRGKKNRGSTQGKSQKVDINTSAWADAPGENFDAANRASPKRSASRGPKEASGPKLEPPTMAALTPSWL